MERNINKIRTFERGLKEKGYDLNGYILFNKIKGSTPWSPTSTFDTPDNDIKNFIVNDLEK